LHGPGESLWHLDGSRSQSFPSVPRSSHPIKPLGLTLNSYLSIDSLTARCAQMKGQASLQALLQAGGKFVVYDQITGSYPEPIWSIQSLNACISEVSTIMTDDAAAGSHFSCEFRWPGDVPRYDPLASREVAASGRRRGGLAPRDQVDRRRASLASGRSLLLAVPGLPSQLPPAV
jgi:hypothetical protein